MVTGSLPGAPSRPPTVSYLHPLAVREVSRLDLTFGDKEDVADLVARACVERQDHELPWKELAGRAKKRCRDTAKRWLNRQAVERMTPELLDERDPEGEVCPASEVAAGWLGQVHAVSWRNVATILRTSMQCKSGDGWHRFLRRKSPGNFPQYRRPKPRLPRRSTLTEHDVTKTP